MKPVPKSQNRMHEWLQDAPAESERLKVATRGSWGSEQSILDISVSELKDKDLGDFCDRIWRQCEAWSDGTGRETTFVASFVSKDDRPLHSLNFRMGPLNANAVPVEGTPESFLLQMQATLLNKDKFQLELMQNVTEMFLRLHQMMIERIADLERQKTLSDVVKEDLIKLEAEGADSGNEAENVKRLTGLVEKLLVAAIESKKSGVVETAKEF